MSFKRKESSRSNNGHHILHYGTDSILLQQPDEIKAPACPAFRGEAGSQSTHVRRPASHHLLSVELRLGHGTVQASPACLRGSETHGLPPRRHLWLTGSGSQPDPSKLGPGLGCRRRWGLTPRGSSYLARLMGGPGPGSCVLRLGHGPQSLAHLIKEADSHLGGVWRQPRTSEHTAAGTAYLL